MWKLFKSKEQKELEKNLVNEHIKEIEKKQKAQEDAFIEIYSEIINLVLPKIVETINFVGISNFSITDLLANNEEELNKIMTNDNWEKLNNTYYGKYFRIEENKNYDELIDKFIEKLNNKDIIRVYSNIEYQYMFGNYIYYMDIEFIPNITVDLEQGYPFTYIKDNDCYLKVKILGKAQIINYIKE